MKINILALSVAVFAGGCHSTAATRPPAVRTPGASMPADAFLAAIASHCGQAFEGRITANQPKSAAPDAFDGKRLVMHVRGCADPAQRIEIPFHVGDDRSRTWVLTRTDTGLRLKHDHRKRDGSPDPITMYGGDTQGSGTAARQTFPVDADSIALFRYNAMPASLDNTWAMEIHPTTFVYELSRPGGRLFRVEFDLTHPITPPSAPWGW